MTTPATASGSGTFANTDENSDDLIQRSSHSNFFIDVDYVVGLFCLIISFGLFLATAKSVDSSFLSSSYIFNYCIAIFYFIYLLAKGKIKFFWKTQSREFQPYRFLLYVIWLVSCFGLNRVVPVFSQSTQWLSTAVFISSLTCILYAWETYFSKYVRNILYLLLGTSTVLWTYYAVYLMQLYPISIPGLLVFGISIHSFIPLMLAIIHYRVLFQKWNFFRRYIIAGIAAPILFFLYFSFQWHIISTKIRSETNNLVAQTNEELPVWVRLGQTVGNDWITERVIKGNLVYQMPDTFLNFMPLNTNTGEISEHDPLVLIASFFSPKTNLSETDRLKLLDVLFDTRHYTQERLWSGRNLRTGNVVTEAKIYPEYRLAYTEKTVSIINHSTAQWSQGEALYTFYLPEGSVVSSLSLWIHGKEEKGYLTTYTKAESAYKTIVGVESRDPSVIHWQEGNTVKIKVFPCTPSENRRFKIGITSPLKVDNHELVYENIYFQGPASNEASETIKLNFSKNVSHLNIPFNSKKIDKNSITAKGFYRPYWEARFETVPVSSGIFSFAGKYYSVKSYQTIPEFFDAKTLYLDVNSSWSEREFDQLCQVLKEKAVYIYDKKFVRLTGSNKDDIFKKLSANRYTLFPIHKITDIPNSLLITKGTTTSPNLKDLQGSQFGESFNNGTQGQPTLRTFNIGNDLSPYIKTLNELRIVRCEKTELDEIKKLVSGNLFPKDPEADTTRNKTTVKIENAKLLIQESDQLAVQNAPDHLLRLFAYNHIMQQIGGQYLSQNYLKASESHTQLLDEASKANIVSPISSLIVLETQADYKRFDIKKSKNSLDNATLKQSGAVPEPHEWALIILFALLVAYFTFRGYVR